MSTPLHIITTINSSTNKVRIDLYKVSDPLTIIASQSQNAPHPETIWTFTDLIPSEVYKWVHVEVDGSDNIIRTYSTVTFTMPATGGIEIKAPIDIIVGTTAGLTDGSTSYTNTDWIGWEAIPERIGFGTLQKNVDYGWNSTTGTFSLFNIGDAFRTPDRYNIKFLPRVIPANTSIIVRDAWSENLIITDDITLTAGDFNKNAIIKGNDGYLKITLPDIFTVVANRLLYFDSTDGSHTCAEITCSTASGNGNLLQWPQPGRNSIYICNNESLAIYREKVSNTVSVWRVKFPDGNFKTVGQFFFSSLDEDDIPNAVEADGRELDYLANARLYNDVVQKQNPGNIVTYAAWSTGNNKYKFSDKNVDGNFHIPDLRDKFMRPASASREPGIFQAQALQSFTLNAPIAPDGNSAGALVYGRGGSSIGNLALNYTGTETRPDNVSERLFILI